MTGERMLGRIDSEVNARRRGHSRSNFMPDDYKKLGLGELTSLITGVTVSAWGSQVTLECLYAPVEEWSPYTLIFEGCQRVEWSVYDSDLLMDEMAELIGISLGVDGLKEAAIIYTDIFELSVLYRSFTIERRGR
jgi:hypothetical protein